MAPKILVADSNEAFATMLKEMLEADGAYAVEVARSEQQVLESLRRGDFSLTIVDMGLAPGGNSYLDLIRKVRQTWPAMRLVLIPFMGTDLPAEARRLGIQGALSKPFFVDDLLPAIQEALSRPFKSPGDTPAAPPPPTARPQPPAAEERPAAGLQPTLAALMHETGADAALYISCASGRADLVAHAGTLAKPAAESLAGLVVAAVRAAQAAARALGQPDAPFEHNMFESGTTRLYVMALPGDRLLALVTPLGTPLGTVRGNLRRATRDLGA